MQPLTVILGIILGSCVSIAFSLSAVLLIFWLLSAEYPRFAAEMPALALAVAVFWTLAAMAAAGFIGTVKARAWRYFAYIGLFCGMVLTGRFYWPV